jgi:hypothetical protein
MRKAVLIALALLVMAPAVNAKELDLSKGTMIAGGHATFDIDMMMPDEGDSTTGFFLNLAPEFGYFIIDNLELFAHVGFGMGFGDLYNDDKTFGFGVGAKYYIPMGPVIGYAGLGVGMDMYMPEKGDTMKDLPITVPLGVLFPFHPHVALDVGTRVTYTMALDDGGTSSLEVPIGYLGMHATF